MKILVVDINGRLYGFELKKTNRIVTDIKYTRIPFVPDIFLGVTILMGEVVTLVSLNRILKIEDFEGKEDMFLLMKGRESSWGFPICNIYDIVEINDDEVEKLDDPYIRGDFKINEKVVLLVDTDKIEDHLYESVSALQE